MDQNNLTNNPAPRTVMDIRPQRPITKPVARPTIAPPPRANYAAPVQQPAAQPASITNQQAVPKTEPAAVHSVSATPPTPRNLEATFKPKPVPAKVPASRLRAPVAAIVVAVIVGLSLAALTVFAYFKGQDQQITENKPTSQTVQVQPEQVDESADAIDTELNSLDDASDFNTTDLNDETLGL